LPPQASHLTILGKLRLDRFEQFWVDGRRVSSG
jgi:hypothetical protein